MNYRGEYGVEALLKNAELLVGYRLQMRGRCDRQNRNGQTSKRAVSNDVLLQQPLALRGASRSALVA
jgi:hypothetical protein